MQPIGTLAITQSPYNFDILLQILARFAHPARQIIHDGKLWQVVCGHLVCFESTEVGIHVLGDTNQDNDIILNTSCRMLGMDIDLSAFYDMAQADKKLWQIIEPLYGLPIFCTETVFEAVITLIIEQHITWKNALRSQQTLLQLLETAHSYQDMTVYDFPSPQQLSRATPDQLKPLKITNRRIDLILQIASELVAGTLDLEAMRELDTSTAYDALMSIKGIGHWTAANVVGRAFGQHPYISHNDVALQAAVQFYFYDDEGKKSAQNVIDTLSAYAEFAGLVGHFTLLRWVLDRYPLVMQG